MYPQMNEEVAWQRLQDIQREIENRRLMAAGQRHVTFETLRRLAARAWLWRAAMRPPRPRPGPIQSDGERRSDVA